MLEIVCGGADLDAVKHHKQEADRQQDSPRHVGQQVDQVFLSIRFSGFGHADQSPYQIKSRSDDNHEDNAAEQIPFVEKVRDRQQRNDQEGQRLEQIPQFFLQVAAVVVDRHDAFLGGHEGDDQHHDQQDREQLHSNQISGLIVALPEVRNQQRRADHHQKAAEERAGEAPGRKIGALDIA